MNEYYIIRNRGVYWRANYAGYTSHIAEAGIYPKDKAMSIVKNKREPPDIAIALEDCKHWIEQDRDLAISIINGAFEKLQIINK